MNMNCRRFIHPTNSAKKTDKSMKNETLLDVELLEERIAPSIVLQNPAGQTPQGGGANNGQAIEAVNPAGHAPPGQN
jgi:hypothetical protein